eukprot:2891283-Rhodomonas_salina.1
MSTCDAGRWVVMQRGAALPAPIELFNGLTAYRFHGSTRVSAPIALRVCYAVSGTERGYAGTIGTELGYLLDVLVYRRLVRLSPRRIVLTETGSSGPLWCYAVSGTELAY